MANNDDNSRQNRERPEDNPFVAFRRFADSQVSSLLNTVFTLPATIANYNNVHQAREACLFQKADKTQCDKLKDIEDEAAQLRHEGRELYRVGDIQQVLKKSEELLRLDRQAEELRRDIVDRIPRIQANEDEKELIQRVANTKGQEWGWDWSWGFPKPFDDDGTRSSHQDQEWWRQDTKEDQERVRKQQWDSYEQFFAEAVKFAEQALGHDAKRQKQDPDTVGYSVEELEADKDMRRTGVNWSEAWADLSREQKKESATTAYPWRRRRRPAAEGYPKRVPWVDEETHDEPSYEYSHDHEDQHDDPPTPKAKQGYFERAPDKKYHESADETHILNNFPEPETELEVYEQLLKKPEAFSLAPTIAPQPIPEAAPVPEANASILSTLTTTERTVAPDGSVTTKVVLKKRFADGREESSETVHTQRGQESQQAPHDPWETMRNAARQPTSDKKEEVSEKPKKSGWFWSS
ncbi:hypothetical protein EK21DRAFT_80487 [Setomelanomma holmii]|uniref:Uncharacterized protein n=1 Tax=Setomelanomma holmii TaxID=210430 RepID=A0A9P4GX75_9PLEO|nr:hypothetical protein EK21DRAFT_80487 [Setomelanomma holmii]